MREDLAKIFITEEALQKRIGGMAADLNRDYAGKELVMICVLRGAIMFYADLLRHIEGKVITAYIAVSSYAGTESSGSIRLQYDLDEDIRGKHVLIVEDIIDSGGTIKYLVDNLKLRKPESIKTCCLLDKPARRKTEHTPDYTGFTIEDEFVVGYGLDYNEKYRNLTVVGVLKEEIYA